MYREVECTFKNISLSLPGKVWRTGLVVWGGQPGLDGTYTPAGAGRWECSTRRDDELCLAFMDSVQVPEDRAGLRITLRGVLMAFCKQSEPALPTAPGSWRVGYDDDSDVIPGVHIDYCYS